MFQASTLIQIHYHDRVGGVSTVMGHYARAFARACAPRTVRNVVMCASDGKSPLPDVETRAVGQCDYRTFRSQQGFFSLREALFGKLARLIGESLDSGPVCVVGHNLSLGKNCALSAAFAQAARTFGGRNDARFFSAVHDLAEEGRGNMLRMIDLIAAGYPIWDDLYPRGCVKRFIVLNERNRELLDKAGLPVTTVLNTVDYLPDTGEPSRTVDLLADLARTDGVPFNRDNPTFLYPVRIISRKNIAEAILVSCLVLGANLLVGSPGPAPADRRLYQRLGSLCRLSKLPVILDAPRIGAALGDRPRQALSRLYGCCDSCISTSVAEGFGYALFEPWLHGKGLVGRLPMGMGAREVIDLEHLYTRLAVPVSWISLDSLVNRYQAAGAGCFGRSWPYPHAGSLLEAMRPSLIDNGEIDFGLLDFTSQLAVVERVSRALRDKGNRTDEGAWLVRARRFMLSHMPGEGQIAGNRSAVADRCSFEGFTDRLGECLLGDQPQQRPGEADREDIRRFFASVERFRLLTTPGA